MNFETLIQTLAAHDVEFIVVGGVAAVLHGAPVTTFDLDTLFSVTAENAANIERALADLEARYRERSDLAPVARDLLGGGHFLLLTSSGPLDLLGFVGKGHRYEELVDQAETYEIRGTAFKVLGLQDLIDIKRETGRQKDLAMLPVLESVLRRRG